MNFLPQLVKSLIATIGPLAATAANAALQAAINAILPHTEGKAAEKPMPADLVSNLLGQVALNPEHALAPDVVKKKIEIYSHIDAEPAAVAKV